MFVVVSCLMRLVFLFCVVVLFVVWCAVLIVFIVRCALLLCVYCCLLCVVAQCSSFVVRLLVWCVDDTWLFYFVLSFDRVYWLFVASCCLLVVFRCRLRFACCLLCIVCFFWRVLFDVCRLSFVGCSLLVCCLLFVVC